MTTVLLLSRHYIICWVNVWLAPVECVFDMIESELERRGIAPKSTVDPALRTT